MMINCIFRIEITLEHENVTVPLYSFGLRKSQEIRPLNMLLKRENMVNAWNSRLMVEQQVQHFPGRSLLYAPMSHRGAPGYLCAQSPF